MSKMAELNDLGVTDLHSYLVGKQHERDELIKVLNGERTYATGFNDHAMIKLTTNLIQLLEASRIKLEPNE
jgi:hypothetical protein